MVRVTDDADDDAVEDLGGAADHVDVAVRDRVVRAWVDGGDHNSNSVSRAEPYLREVRSLEARNLGRRLAPGALVDEHAVLGEAAAARCGASRLES